VGVLGCFGLLYADTCIGLARTVNIYTPYMTVYLVISLPTIPYVNRICMVLANPTHAPVLFQEQCCRVLWIISRIVLLRVVDFLTNSVAACCGLIHKQCCRVLWIISRIVLLRVVNYFKNSVAACCGLFHEQCCCVLWIISRKVLPRVVDYLKNSFAVCCGLLVSFACFE